MIFNKIAYPPALRDILLLLLACAGLWGWTYGRWDLSGPDETRYVQVAKELLQRPDGNWFLMTVNGQPYDQKPPLPFWMFALMLKYTGGEVNTWAVRFPSVVMGSLVVILTYLLGRRRFNRQVGWLAAWILLTSPLIIDETPSARLDILFTGFVMISMWAWLARPPGEPLPARRALLFWLGFIGAFFIKGPPVFIFTLIPPAWEAWTRRSWRPLRELWPVTGFSIFLALLLGWLWVQKMTAPPGFVEGQIESATVHRLFSTTVHSEMPWYYLLNIFLEGILPWSLFLAAALWKLWPRRDEQREHRPLKNKTRRFFSNFVSLLRQDGGDRDQQDRLRPLLSWFVIVFILFSLITGKREQYLLPLFPAMALLVAWFMDRHLFQQPLPAVVRQAAVVLLPLAGCVAGAWGIAFLLSPALKEKSLWNVTPLISATWIITGIGLALSGLAWRGIAAWPRAIALLMITVYIGAAVALATAFPAMNQRKSPRFVSEFIDSQRRPGEQAIGAWDNALKPEYQVYGNFRMIPLHEDDAETLKKPLPRIIIMREKEKKDSEQFIPPGDYDRAFLSQLGGGLGVYIKK